VSGGGSSRRYLATFSSVVPSQDLPSITSQFRMGVSLGSCDGLFLFVLFVGNRGTIRVKVPCNASAMSKLRGMRIRYVCIHSAERD
jgi:hypothetical protein